MLASYDVEVLATSSSWMTLWALDDSTDRSWQLDRGLGIISCMKKEHTYIYVYICTVYAVETSTLGALAVSPNFFFFSQIFANFERSIQARSIQPRHSDVQALRRTCGPAISIRTIRSALSLSILRPALSAFDLLSIGHAHGASRSARRCHSIIEKATALSRCAFDVDLHILRPRALRKKEGEREERDRVVHSPAPSL